MALRSELFPYLPTVPAKASQRWNGRLYLGCACHTLVREGRFLTVPARQALGTRKGPQVKPTPPRKQPTHADPHTGHRLDVVIMDVVDGVSGMSS
jgi:hypothetical protein